MLLVISRMWKRWILVPLPLPRFRFHKNVVFSLLAIPPTNAEAAGPADRFRFRIPDFFLHRFKKSEKSVDSNDNLDALCPSSSQVDIGANIYAVPCTEPRCGNTSWRRAVRLRDSILWFALISVKRSTTSMIHTNLTRSDGDSTKFITSKRNFIRET